MQTKDTSYKIFLISVLTLFLELLLIRWVGTEINIFAYLQNTVLIVCFFGIGVGCFSSQRPARLAIVPISLLALVTLLSVPASRNALMMVSGMLSVLGDFVVWDAWSIDSTSLRLKAFITGFGFATGILFLVAMPFVPLGRILGKLLDEHPRTILAYSLNVGGSLVGIWGFVVLTKLQTSPYVWFAICGVLTCLLIGRLNREFVLQAALFAAITAIAFAGEKLSPAIEVVWSPYQKLSLHPPPTSDRDLHRHTKLAVHVNNTGYQWIQDYSFLKSENPEDYASSANEAEDIYVHYNIPFLLHPNAQKVMIVGAGTGNDVAAALRFKLEAVTAVEIDPAIIAFGLQYHPEKPYSSASVQVVEDDARSFFMQTPERYDVVVFGLLDSHSTTSMTNARLDHYVYTKESLEQVKKLLRKDGIVVLTFQAQMPFIVARIQNLLQEVFKQQPLVFHPTASGTTVFVVGSQNTVRSALNNSPKLAEKINSWQEQSPITADPSVEVTTDNWPYLYLNYRAIPSLYLWLAGLLGLVFYLVKRSARVSLRISSWNASHWHFFFLGAAFLLLEVQNVSQASVVFGHTWLTNAVVISGILCLILLANLVAAYFPRLANWFVYSGLILTCLLLYAIDLASFGSLSAIEKILLVGLLPSVPIFFAGIAFIRSFALIDKKDMALGANLLGALVGGYLQCLTFITGVKATLLLVAAFYGCAALLSLKTLPTSQNNTGKPGGNTVD